MSKHKIMLLFLISSLIISLTTVFIRPVFAVYDGYDGFESMDFSLWETENGSPEIAIFEEVFEGDYSFNRTTADPETVMNVLNDTAISESSPASLWMGAWVYVDEYSPDQSGTNGHVAMLTIETGGAHNVEMGITKDGSGNLIIWSGNREGTNWGYGSILQTDAWYYWRLHAYYTGSGYPYTWSWETYLNDTQQDANSVGDGYSDTIDRVYVGNQYGAWGASVTGRLSVFIDNVNVSTSEISYSPTSIFIQASSAIEIGASFWLNGTEYTTPQVDLTLTGATGLYQLIIETSKTFGGSNYEFSYATINSTDYWSSNFWLTITGNTTFLFTYAGDIGENPWVPPIYSSDGLNATWYLRSDTHTVHSQLGYILSPVQTSSELSDMRTHATTSMTTSYGVRIWVFDADGDSSELTSGIPVAVVTRSSDGDGIQSATWTCPDYLNVVDAVMVRIYQRWGTDAWTARLIYITKSGLLVKFPTASWTFNYYTNRTSGSTNSTMWYGSYVYNSRLQLYYTNLNPFETMHYHLIRTDFLAFLVTPWTYFLGDIFYGLILLFMSVTTYLRYHSLRAILALVWLFGGVGGILTAMIPAVAFNIAWLFLAIALAITLVKLVR